MANNRIKRGKMAVLFKFLRTNAWILGITILCMVLFFSFIDLYAILSRTNAHRDNQWLEILIIIILFLIPVAFIYAIFHVIHMTLTGASRNLQMGSVLLSYIAVIFVFSGFYYFQSAISDLYDAKEEYRYYENLRTPAMAGAVDTYGELLHRKESRRALHGLSATLWHGLRQKVAGWPDEAGLPPISKMIDAARLPIDDVVTFNEEAKSEVYLDCLYFSTMTITSTGFGDIFPENRLGKMFASIESVMGVLLVAIGIAIALGGLGSSVPPDNDRTGYNLEDTQ